MAKLDITIKRTNGSDQHVRVLDNAVSMHEYGQTSLESGNLLRITSSGSVTLTQSNGQYTLTID